jgi:hypothetical protein
MTGENFCANAAGRGRLHSVQSSVNAHDTRKVLAASRQLKDRQPSEAITHRGRSSIHSRMLIQHSQPCPGTLTKKIRITAQFRYLLHDSVTITGNAFSEHIASKYDKTGFCETQRAVPGVVIETGTSMDYQYPGPRL